MHSSLIALAIGALAMANAAPTTVQTITNSTVPFKGPAPNSPSWTMSTWTGTSCQGTEVFWIGAPYGYTCIALR